MIGYSYNIKNSYNGAEVNINVNDQSNYSSFAKNGFVLTDYPTFDIDVRNEEQVKAGQHGIWDFYSYYGKRVMTFTGLILGSTRQDTLYLQEQLQKVFNLPSQPISGINDGYVTVTWADHKGDEWFVEAKIQQDLTFNRNIGIQDSLNFFVSLKCKSPFILSSTQSQETGVMGWRQGALILPTLLPNNINIYYNNMINIYQDGTAEAPATYRLYGAAENPKITRLDETVSNSYLISNFVSGWVGGEEDTTNFLQGGSARKVTSVNNVQGTIQLVKSMNLDIKEDISSIVTASDIKGYWKLNGNYLDSSGGNHTATAFNTPTILDNYLILDGINQYLSVTDNDDFSFGDGVSDEPFSISAMVNMADATDFSILSKGVIGVLDGEWLLICYDKAGVDTLAFILIDGTNPANFISREYSVDMNNFEDEWIQIVGTYDGSGTVAGIKLYINGSRVDDTDNTNGIYTAMDNGSEAVYIGNYDSNYSSGKYENIFIYSDELTGIEVMDLYYNTVEWVSMYLYIDNIDNIATGDYLVGQNYLKFIENVGVDEFVIELAVGNITLRNGWNYFRVLKDQFENIGNPNWDDIESVELSIKSKAGSTLNITFDSLYVKNIEFTENKLELTYNLSLGEYVDFDVLNGTITKNDGTDLSSYLTLDSGWFYLKPGENSLFYESDTNPLPTWVEPTERFDVFWRETNL